MILKAPQGAFLIFINIFSKIFIGKRHGFWGSKDSVYSDGTIAISGTTVTGTGTTFNTSGLINPGDVITVGTGSTQGEAVIAGVTSATVLTLEESPSTLDSGTITGATYVISQRPISTIFDTNYGAAEVYGVDKTEVGVAATTAYAVAHSGWVGMTTYTDAHGNLRVKSEVLVAGGITGDNDTDDTIFADS